MTDKAKIKKQVEFYFSDPNIVFDKFLKSQIGQHPEGFVALSVLATFNKLKSISNDGDVPTIAAALEDSEELLLDESKKMVKRKRPVPESYDGTPRSLYCKGVPTDASMETVQEFFEKFGVVMMVRRRFFRGRDKKQQREAKPSVFVEFKTKEECEKFMEAKPCWTGTEEPLEIKWKADKEAEELAENPQKAKQAQRRQRQQSASEGAGAAGGEAGEAKEGDDTKTSEDHKLPVGQLAVCTTETSLGWQEVKDGITDVDDSITIRHVERTDDKLMVVTRDADSLEKLVGKEEGFKIGDVELKFKKVEGEDETTFLEDLEKRYASRGRGRGRGGGRGGRGGRGRGGRGFKREYGGRGGRGGNKKQKTD